MSIIWRYILVAFAFLATILGALANARRQGRKEEQGVQAERALEQVKEGSHVDQAVKSSSDAALDDKLRQHTRD